MNILLAEDDRVARATLKAVLAARKIRAVAGKPYTYFVFQTASLERYIEARSTAEFSHGVCPDCYQKHLKPQIG